MSAATPGSDWVFVARQPILDAMGRLFAYELLFRPSGTAAVAGTASDHASARVITDAVLDFGLDTLTQGRLAFINVTRQFLIEGLPLVLPPNRVVVELLEDIEADAEVLKACQELRKGGYSLALDDFTLSERTSPLVPFADYLKVDMLSVTDLSTSARMLRRCSAGHAALLAEKIETVESFNETKAEGFQYFQGFFFGYPVIETTRTIPPHHLAHLKFLRDLHHHNVTIDQLEELIKHDATLCYRVLRVANSAALAQRREVQSVRQALVLLGLDNVRRWLSVWLLASVSQGAHPELAVMSAVRARCCELIGGRLFGPDAETETFLLGMCSLLDAILQRPMEVVVTQLPLTEPTKRALIGDDNSNRRVLDCVVAYERGHWDTCLRVASDVGIDPATIPVAHKEALQWASDFQKAA
jgi:c-di-GMP-related signal transduction protein